MKKGRKQDVLLERVIYTDPRTGVKMPSDLSFAVWADEQMKDTISAVEGVVQVYVDIAVTKYHVYVDKRYEMEFIMREVEAAIKCAGV